MAGVVVIGTPPVTLSIDDVAQNEGKRSTTTFTFTVTRSGDTSGSVTVDYATADGTARAGSDYYATSGSLSFASGITSQTINVSVVGDRTAEPNEMFFVNLNSAVGGTIAEDQGVGTGTILNDDGAPLMAAFDEQASTAQLTMAQVAQLTPLAVPSDLRFETHDLPSGQLGEAFQHTITLDTNANGTGWYVDRAIPTAGRVDLLTVLTHEIGHVLGYEHSSDSTDLMAATLPLGTRRLPGGAQASMAFGRESAALSLLLLPDRQLKGASDALMDYPLMNSPANRGTRAGNNPWTLPFIPPDYVVQPQRTSETTRAQVIKTITDEEMELLDDELSDLIAARGQ